MFADLAGGLVAGEALGMPDCLDWAPFQHIAGERTWHTQDSHGQILALDFWCSPWARERDLAWLGCAPLVVVGGFQEDRQDRVFSDLAGGLVAGEALGMPDCPLAARLLRLVFHQIPGELTVVSEGTLGRSCPQTPAGGLSTLSCWSCNQSETAASHPPPDTCPGLRVEG